MRKYGIALAGVALTALVAGCSGTGVGGGSPSPATSSSPARSATDELVAAATKLRSGTYKFTVKVNTTTVDGSADPSVKGVQVASRANVGGAMIDLGLRVIGTDVYAQVDGLSALGINKDTWLHADASKIKSLSLIGLADPSDPTGASSLRQQIVTASKSGSDYTGTLDLTKASVAGVPVSTITTLGDKAKSVPFKATVDAQGRLSKFSFTVPAQGGTPEMPVEITYSDFGAAVNITKPTSNVVEAPPLLYTFLGG